jgi:uncharacterized protein
MPHAPFTDADFDELDDFLLHRPTGLLDCVTLEGFLTALVIGPVTVEPAAWLPRVFGGKHPKFRNEEQASHYLSLVLRFHDELVDWFAFDPDHFEPTFNEHRVGRKTCLIVDEWCDGFVKGMRLAREAWKPLRKDRPELLRPIELFGTRKGWRELEAGGEARMHATWSKRIAPAVRDIHAYWRAQWEMEQRARSGAALH